MKSFTTLAFLAVTIISASAKDCVSDIESNVVALFNFAGVGVYWQPGATPAACGVLCEQQSNCMFWMYDGGNCILHSDAPILFMNNMSGEYYGQCHDVSPSSTSPAAATPLSTSMIEPTTSLYSTLASETTPFTPLISSTSSISSISSTPIPTILETSSSIPPTTLIVSSSTASATSSTTSSALKTSNLSQPTTNSTSISRIASLTPLAATITANSTTSGAAAATSTASVSASNNGANSGASFSSSAIASGAAMMGALSAFFLLF